LAIRAAPPEDASTRRARGVETDAFYSTRSGSQREIGDDGLREGQTKYNHDSIAGLPGLRRPSL
jgi:hypothetical protein